MKITYSMFFTVLSKTVFQNNTSPRKYFYLFVVGIVFYIALHYFLFMKSHGELVDKMKKYLYYVVPADFALAFFLMNSEKKEKKSEDESDSDDEQGGGHKYTKEEMKKNSQNMARARKIQEHRRNVEKARTSPFAKANKKPIPKETTSSSSEKQQPQQGKDEKEPVEKKVQVVEQPEQPKNIQEENQLLQQRLAKLELNRKKQAELEQKQKLELMEKENEKELIDTDIPLFKSE